jgi:hypothetical protein
MKLNMILLLTLAIAMLGNAAYTQEIKTAKNEITLGYGCITGLEMANSLISIWPAIGISIGKDSIKDYTNSFYGVADLEYLRYVNPWIRVGASFSVNPISTVIRTKSGRELTWTYYVFSLMPRVDFIYVRKGILSMYSGVQAGAAFIFWQDKQGSSTSTDFGVEPAFHVNIFGVRVGKEIGAFMEWGVGYRGTFNIGVSGKF